MEDFEAVVMSETTTGEFRRHSRNIKIIWGIEHHQ